MGAQGGAPLALIRSAFFSLHYSLTFFKNALSLLILLMQAGQSSMQACRSSPTPLLPSISLCVAHHRTND